MHDLVLLDSHEAELRTLLDMGSGIEAAAYVVFGRSVIRRDPWSRNARIRLVSHRVIPISAEEQIQASAVHVTWSTRGFVRELARATGEHLVLGIVHSHPGGRAVFSPQDDHNEADLIRAAANRNGAGAELVSLLFGYDGTMASRVWNGSGEGGPISRITVTGAQWRVYSRFENGSPKVAPYFRPAGPSLWGGLQRHHARDADRRRRGRGHRSPGGNALDAPRCPAPGADRP